MLAKRIRNSFFVLLATACLLTPLGTVWASDDHPSSLRLDYWTYGVKGNSSIKGVSLDINETSKVIDGNNQGFVLGGDYMLDNWGLMMDLFVGKQDVTKQLSSSQSVDWGLRTTMFSVAAFLPVVDNEMTDGDQNLRLDVLGGLRGYVNYYKIEFNPYDPLNDQDRSGERNWLDPYVGLRFKTPVIGKLSAEIYGDAGGFAIGSASELSVLTWARASWAFTDSFNVALGYRLLNLKSGQDNGSVKTQQNTQTKGLTLGIEGRF
jgi:hypothetical protein